MTDHNANIDHLRDQTGTSPGTAGTVRQLTIAELADDAFLKAERVRALGMMNTPTDFEERRKAFIQLAEAQAAAARAHQALEAAVRTGQG